MEKQEIDRLLEADLAHQLHPQFHVRDHQDPVLFVRGQGALLWDPQG
ncbi:MAG: hypothetical protein IIC26_00775, partial [Chloroflexi bacterium]|nr:hypothetical protein [Chloroflexota bacterium]